MSDEVVAAVKANDKRVIEMQTRSTVVMYHEELWIGPVTWRDRRDDPVELLTVGGGPPRGGDYFARSGVANPKAQFGTLIGRRMLTASPSPLMAYAPSPFAPCRCWRRDGSLRILICGSRAPAERRFLVRCEACGSTGDAAPTMAAAVEAWNAALARDH